MTWYNNFDDGSINQYCFTKEQAEARGLIKTSEKGIVFAWDGKKYLDGEEPTRPTTFDDYDNAMETHLDAEKAARGYTKREPSDYAGSSNPRWAQDAQDWIAHRDAVMAYGLEVENKAKAGEPVPTLEEFKTNLPKITWTYNTENAQ